MQVSIIGIDLAKNVFQVAALNRAGKPVMNKAVRRAKLLDMVRQFEPTVLAMEACGSAHYWARQFRAMGFEVRIIPPQHVKPFVRINKTDAADALAICEAAQRPSLRFVPIKSVEQQDLRLIDKRRTRLVHQRTATVNQIRGFAREYGVFFPVGYKRLMKELPAVLEQHDHELTPIARQVLFDLFEEVQAISEKIDGLRDQLAAVTKHNTHCHDLIGIPALGPLVSASFLAGVGDGSQFTNGRQCAAWLGLVPRMHGSGGRTNVLSITKNGDCELRTMLIHGARSVVRWAHKRDDAMGRWIMQLKARRGTNKTVVALANKLARIAWAVVAHNEPFDINKAFA